MNGEFPQILKNRPYRFEVLSYTASRFFTVDRGQFRTEKTLLRNVEIQTCFSLPNGGIASFDFLVAQLPIAGQMGREILPAKYRVLIFGISNSYFPIVEIEETRKGESARRNEWAFTAEAHWGEILEYPALIWRRKV